MRAGANALGSKDSTCTISVVPTLAPSMAARPGIRATTPPAAKPVIIRPVAVLLCMIAVMVIPVKNARSEEHQSELQSLMRISYAVFCLKKKQTTSLKSHYTNYLLRLG